MVRSLMKNIPERASENNPSPDSPKAEIEEVIQSLRDITREIEKVATEKEKK
jgi:hypothetical protein